MKKGGWVPCGYIAMNRTKDLIIICIYENEQKKYYIANLNDFLERSKAAVSKKV